MQAQLQQYDRILSLIEKLSEEEKTVLDEILTAELPRWTPIEGPQSAAYYSDADILFYGGAAGGSKTDLLLGLSLNQHNKSIIFRREGTQLVAIVDRLSEIIGTRDGYNGQTHVWRLPDRQIEFGSCPNAGDEVRFQGRSHDLIAFDEIGNFLESQFRFLCGWNRTTVPGQRCRIVCAGNPPTSSEGEWVIQYWGPWLDPQHPYPAKPGELRWYAMLDGKEQPVDSGAHFDYKGKKIKPKSRSFLPSSIADNPFLMATDYEATLQALPEPLRSQMLEGSFVAGKEDSPWQVIPTAWIDAAMGRWKETGKVGQMDSVGVDVARGGPNTKNKGDNTVIACRFGTWYAPLKKYPGKETPDGPTTAGLVVSEVRDKAPIHVDVIGVGGSVVDHLRGLNIHVEAINGADAAPVGATDKASGRLKFRNMRAFLYWQFRESLDPKHGDNLALPPDSKLKADLCSVHWKLTAGGVLIESKEDIIKRLGRSPDDGDAVIYCSVNTVKSTGKDGVG